MAFQRGKRWVGVREHQGKRISRSFDTQEQAMEFENPHQSVGVLFWDAYNLYWKGSKDEQAARGIVSELVDRLGAGTSVLNIPPNCAIRMVQVWREGNLSNKTINRKLSKLSKALRYVKTAEPMFEVPTIPRMKEDKGRIRYLTKEEAERLLEAIDNPLFQRFATFLLYTGCRYSEGANIQWQDIRNDRATFWETKGNKARTVPLNQKAKEAVGDDRSSPKPFPLVYMPFWRAFHKAKEKAGLNDPDIVIHTLRHTCASWLVQAGVDIRRVKDWMGHSSIGTTMLYAHLAPGDLDEIAEKLCG